MRGAALRYRLAALGVFCLWMALYGFVRGGAGVAIIWASIEVGVAVDGLLTRRGGRHG